MVTYNTSKTETVFNNHLHFTQNPYFIVLGFFAEPEGKHLRELQKIFTSEFVATLHFEMLSLKVAPKPDSISTFLKHFCKYTPKVVFKQIYHSEKKWGRRTRFCVKRSCTLENEIEILAKLSWEKNLRWEFKN